MPYDRSAIKIIQTLKRRYTQKPDMDLGNPEDSLIATILSARTTDAQVLKVFPSFRQKFPTWQKLAKTDPSEIARSLSAIGLYRNKAKSLHLLAKKLLNDFQGQIPLSMEQMVTLPGVGRKTASCVLSYCFKIPAIAVDTHVFRIAKRLGWSRGATPEKVERDIKDLLPEKYWNEVNRTMVRFGREICTAGKKPKCYLCPLAKWCPYEPKINR